MEDVRAQGAAGAAGDAAVITDELRIAVWAMSRRMRGEVQGEAAIPIGQQSVLALLEQTPGMTSAELAREERVRPQSMNTTVAALRAAGLVGSSVSAVDGRRHELVLTAAGQEMLDRIRAMRSDWLTRRIERDLGDEDRAVLRRSAYLMRCIATDTAF